MGTGHMCACKETKITATSLKVCICKYVQAVSESVQVCTKAEHISNVPSEKGCVVSAPSAVLKIYGLGISRTNHI